MIVQPVSFMGYPIKIIPASKPTSLEQNVEKLLNKRPTPTVVKKFANGETYVNIKEDVRNTDVYIMPSVGSEVNDNLMETYLKADAAKRMGAHKIIAILPNFLYGRQERKTEPGEAISAALNVDFLRASGVDEVITSDMHTTALQGLSKDMPITEVSSMDTMVEYFNRKNLNKDNLVVVSPDLGGLKRADKFAKKLGCDKAVIYKVRAEHNEAKAEALFGDVKGKNCIVYDDMIDTAGTITEAAKILKEQGARDIYLCAAHGMFNGKAIERLKSTPIKEVVVSNSERKPEYKKIKQVDISLPIAGKMMDISG